MSTHQIARQLGLEEGEVAGRLARMPQAEGEDTRAHIRLDRRDRLALVLERTRAIARLDRLARLLELVPLPRRPPVPRRHVLARDHLVLDAVEDAADGAELGVHVAAARADRLVRAFDRRACREIVGDDPARSARS